MNISRKVLVQPYTPTGGCKYNSRIFQHLSCAHAWCTDDVVGEVLAARRIAIRYLVHRMAVRRHVM